MSQDFTNQLNNQFQRPRLFANWNGPQISINYNDEYYMHRYDTMFLGTLSEDHTTGVGVNKTVQSVPSIVPKIADTLSRGKPSYDIIAKVSFGSFKDVCHINDNDTSINSDFVLGKNATVNETSSKSSNDSIISMSELEERSICKSSLDAEPISSCSSDSGLIERYREDTDSKEPLDESKGSNKSVSQTVRPMFLQPMNTYGVNCTTYNIKTDQLDPNGVATTVKDIIS